MRGEAGGVSICPALSTEPVRLLCYSDCHQDSGKRHRLRHSDLEPWDTAPSAGISLNSTLPQSLPITLCELTTWGPPAPADRRAHSHDLHHDSGPPCPDERVDTLTSHYLELVWPSEDGRENQRGKGRRRKRRPVRIENLRRQMGPFLNRPSCPLGVGQGFALPVSTETVWIGAALARAHGDCVFALGADCLLCFSSGLCLHLSPGPRAESWDSASACAHAVAFRFHSS